VSQGAPHRASGDGVTQTTPTPVGLRTRDGFVLGWSRTRLPGPLVTVGRSYGGSGIGLADEARHLAVGGQHADGRDHRARPGRVRRWARWHAALPAITLARGHLPGRRTVRWWVRPEELGVAEIGHVGLFHARFADTFWPATLTWPRDGAAPAGMPGRDDRRRPGAGDGAILPRARSAPSRHGDPASRRR